MAKSKIDMNKLTLGAAKPVVKPAAEAKHPESVVEETVREIHQPQKTPKKKPAKAAATPQPVETPPPPANPEPAAEAPRRMGRPATRDRANSVRLSVDVPKPLFKRAKKKLIDLDMTMIEYVTQLIERDLEG